MRSLSPSLWCKIPHIVHFIAVQLFLSSTALDPFLVMRDRNIRKRLKHLFCCHNNCSKYYSYRSNANPEMAHSRDFDAIRNVVAKALNLVTAEHPATGPHTPTQEWFCSCYILQWQSAKATCAAETAGHVKRKSQRRRE